MQKNARQIGIKLYKFSTLMVNVRKPTTFDCPNALNFDLSEAKKKNEGKKMGKN